MSGAGAGAVARVLVALSYRGAGRPVRWLVTITGELFFSNVASATNSNAKSTEPTTAKKVRTGIGACPPAGFRKKHRSGSTGPQKWPSATDQTQSHAHLYQATVQLRAHLYLS